MAAPVEESSLCGAITDISSVLATTISVHVQCVHVCVRVCVCVMVFDRERKEEGIALATSHGVRNSGWEPVDTSTHPST